MRGRDVSAVILCLFHRLSVFYHICWLKEIDWKRKKENWIRKEITRLVIFSRPLSCFIVILILFENVKRRLSKEKIKRETGVFLSLFVFYCRSHINWKGRKKVELKGENSEREMRFFPRPSSYFIFIFTFPFPLSVLYKSKKNVRMLEEEKEQYTEKEEMVRHSRFVSRFLVIVTFFS